VEYLKEGHKLSIVMPIAAGFDLSTMVQYVGTTSYARSP
jgi:hypothetical protein